MASKKFAVQTKSYWANDTWETVDYFDAKPEAEAKKAELISTNTGDAKNDVQVRISRKVISLTEMESVATRGM